MYTNILIPTDGSELAGKAIPLRRPAADYLRSTRTGSLLERVGSYLTASFPRITFVARQVTLTVSSKAPIRRKCRSKYRRNSNWSSI